MSQRVLALVFFFNAFAVSHMLAQVEFTPHTLLGDEPGFKAPLIAEAVDLDRDGDLDVLAGDGGYGYEDYSKSEIIWFDNNGGQEFSPHVITTELDEPVSVRAVDLEPTVVHATDVDSDGDIDILSAWGGDATSGSRIVWHENDGSQNFTAHTVTAAADGARSIFAATSSGLFRSTDNGDTWNKLVNGLTNPLTFSLIIDNDGNLFAGSGTLYRTTDGGDTWRRMDSGLQGGAFALAINSKDHIYAGGHDGVFRSESFTTSVKEFFAEFPQDFILEQNYPNPFNPRTTIRFSLPERARVTLEIIDLTGRMVATLVDEALPPGRYETPFDASGLASGVYFYRLSAGPSTGSGRGFVRTKKLVVVK